MSSCSWHESMNFFLPLLCSNTRTTSTYSFISKCLIFNGVAFFCFFSILPPPPLSLSPFPPTASHSSLFNSTVLFSASELYVRGVSISLCEQLLLMLSYTAENTTRKKYENSSNKFCWGSLFFFASSWERRSEKNPKAASPQQKNNTTTHGTRLWHTPAAHSQRSPRKYLHTLCVRVKKSCMRVKILYSTVKPRRRWERVCVDMQHIHIFRVHIKPNYFT